MSWWQAALVVGGAFLIVAGFGMAIDEICSRAAKEEVDRWRRSRKTRNW